MSLIWWPGGGANGAGGAGGGGGVGAGAGAEGGESSTHCDDDRKMYLQAAIVRIMKQRKVSPTTPAQPHTLCRRLIDLLTLVLIYSDPDRFHPLPLSRLWIIY